MLALSFTCLCVVTCVQLFTTFCTVARQAPLFVEFSRQEYWSGLPFPSPGDLPNPGIEPGSPALEADSLLVKDGCICCCSVAKLYPILCHLMDYSMPGFPVLHYLLECAQNYVHWVSDAIQPSHPLSPASPPALNFSQHQGLYNESALCIRIVTLSNFKAERNSLGTVCHDSTVKRCKFMVYYGQVWTTGCCFSVKSEI